MYGQQQHFVYRDALGGIWDSYYDQESNTWHLQQINAGGTTSGPLAFDNPFVSVFGEQQHFAYRDDAGTIWNSWYDRGDNKWALERINTRGWTNAPAATGGPFLWVKDQQHHFTYPDSIGNIWDSCEQHLEHAIDQLSGQCRTERSAR